MGGIAASGGSENPAASGSQEIAAAAQSPANRSVAKAVQILNSINYAGAGREIHFSVDRASKELVVTVIDSDTKKVITQWPSKYVLELASELNSQSKGEIHDESLS